MNRSHRRFVLLCAAMFALAGVAFAGVAGAQTPPPARSAQNAPEPPEWERLTQAQREAVMAVVRERWNANPGQRAKMLQHAERWQRMTPEQRQRAQQGQRRWAQMTPQQRKQARAKFELGRDLPPEQRAALRAELKAMTPEQRREWMRTHRRQQGQQGKAP
jgi:hypothetical protein